MVTGRVGQSWAAAGAVAAKSAAMSVAMTPIILMAGIVPPVILKRWSIFRKMPALAKAGVDTGFPSENATMKKC
jgi:hypothetical protein